MIDTIANTPLYLPSLKVDSTEISYIPSSIPFTSKEIILLSLISFIIGIMIGLSIGFINKYNKTLFKRSHKSITNEDKPIK